MDYRDSWGAIDRLRELAELLYELSENTGGDRATIKRLEVDVTALVHRYEAEVRSGVRKVTKLSEWRDRVDAERKQVLGEWVTPDDPVEPDRAKPAGDDGPREKPQQR